VRFPVFRLQVRAASNLSNARFSNYWIRPILLAQNDDGDDREVGRSDLYRSRRLVGPGSSISRCEAESAKKTGRRLCPESRQSRRQLP